MNSLLEHDHEELGGILGDLIAALGVGDIEESFKERVYQWTDKLLNRREQTRLAAKLRREIENPPPRFSGTDADD